MADNQVVFQVDGPGRLIGLGNGDSSYHEPDKPASFVEGKRSAFNRLCMTLCQALKQPGQIHVEVSSAGLERATTVIASAQANLRPAI
jgi:beta-galactosidase